MKRVLAMLATFAAISIYAASDVRAAPAGPINIGTNSDVVLVAEGCGRGWHRNRYGRCVRNLSPRWPCWWVRGPYGAWRLVCR